jgi:beta-glucosidase
MGTWALFSLNSDLNTAQLFPPDFLWGTATSAYQVEGGICNDWSAAGFDAGSGVEHYERYSEDFGHAADLGTNAFRLSLEWARLEPQEGVWDLAEIAHYQAVLDSLRAHDLEPMVTLFHFTLPEWFARKGGWTRSENLRYFTRFVAKIADSFGSQVKLWITLNEPMVYVFKCFDEGTWPPFVKDRSLALRVFQNLLQGHAQAYAILHQASAQVQVGIAKNITCLESVSAWSPLAIMQAYFQDRLFNRAFLEAVVKGQFKLLLPTGKLQIGPDPLLMGSLDFLGVNYYTRFKVNAKGEHLNASGAVCSELNWEIYPDGLLKALRLAHQLTQALNLPIYITENGLADANDRQRGPFLTAHLRAVLLALAEGIPLKGYFYWSLLDNFEWAEGYEPRFGLLDSQRQWRPSAYLYKALIQRYRGYRGP